jgi:peptide/nickel transport system substrate-binding protein
VVTAAGALAPTGCTAGGGGNATNAAPTGGTVTMAIVNDLTSLNSNTPQGNLDTNGQYVYLTTGGFFYPDNSFNLVKDESFGTYEKTSDDPLTVKYTLKKDLKWSDGEPITADDMVLAWAIARATTMTRPPTRTATSRVARSTSRSRVRRRASTRPTSPRWATTTRRSR